MGCTCGVELSCFGFFTLGVIAAAAPAVERRVWRSQDCCVAFGVVVFAVLFEEGVLPGNFALSERVVFAVVRLTWPVLDVFGCRCSCPQVVMAASLRVIFISLYCSEVAFCPTLCTTLEGGSWEEALVRISLNSFRSCTFSLSCSRSSAASAVARASFTKETSPCPAAAAEAAVTMLPASSLSRAEMVAARVALLVTEATVDAVRFVTCSTTLPVASDVTAATVADPTAVALRIHLSTLRRNNW
mmetsp:Transcript_14015/g.36080  ORF Transcript_14015/g.36080 Transcript_14015/m.36080 type:complete len:244 (+) Transcript_14015:661-1392(+)